MRKVLFTFFAILLSVVVMAEYLMVDDLGRLVTFEGEVNRVISAAPAVSDYIKYLGLEGKVVGVTDWDTTIDTENIGNLVPLNLEKIISLNPDLVFLTGGFQEPEISRLERYNIKSFVINPVNFNDIYRDIVLIGSILGEKDKAETLSNELRQSVLSIAKSSFNWKNKPTVLYLMVQNNVSEIWTAGTGSYINELISYAGGLNLAAPYTGNNGFLQVGPEFVVAQNPDIIIVDSYYEGDETAKNTLLNAKQFENVKAVKEGKIVMVDGNKISQASPSLIDVLEQLYEYFGENK
ncbi:ABC transporter substrate-binding protein [Petrotoga olearia]|uniref:Iron ABC transporter substrate-binding protein n=2 Tax=Petrotoga olearia TaxID=156203 RepID=A0A2K1NWM4_9BACT|nr:ABC transporter substrate-binding protein [Petrotoga olearia]PNR94935.1 iron ABC transporter substrate-binding protein [Petrotoga olearia DSM 13574]RMA73233.1 iron complex transport system substrate-binding protein [Petrotoga olearia]